LAVDPFHGLAVGETEYLELLVFSLFGVLFHELFQGLAELAGGCLVFEGLEDKLGEEEPGGHQS
jgi:hypothetical protein